MLFLFWQVRVTLDRAAVGFRDSQLGLETPQERAEINVLTRFAEPKGIFLRLRGQRS